MTGRSRSFDFERNPERYRGPSSPQASQLQSPAAVRGGLMLLEQYLPELADGYARYYIRDAGRTPGAHPQAQLVALFPIPDAIRAQIAQQLDEAQGGI